MRGQIRYKFDYYFQYVFNDPKLPDEVVVVSSAHRGEGARSKAQGEW